MNRKDLLSLMEAYDDVILNKEFSPEDENEIDFSDKPNPEAGLEVKSVDDVGLDEPDMGLDEPDMGLDEPSDIDFSDGGLENQKIVIAHLHTIRSHAHEINTCIENGADIDPEMAEKIAMANDYIIDVANAIMYRK